jgi:hypothetical protein
MDSHPALHSLKHDAPIELERAAVFAAAGESTAKVAGAARPFLCPKSCRLCANRPVFQLDNLTLFHGIGTVMRPYRENRS